MNNKDKSILQLIEQLKNQKCEHQHLELKKAESGAPKVYDTLSSFANQEGGGVILFGIDEKKDFNICGVYDSQALQVQITNQGRQMTPEVHPYYSVATIEGKNIVSASIEECASHHKPCFKTESGRLKGSYVRVGDADLRMSESEIYNLECYKRNIKNDKRPVTEAAKEDLNPLLTNNYLEKVRTFKPRLAKSTPDQILKFSGLLEDNKPTLAGLLLLGEYPQQFFPLLSVTAVRIKGTEIQDSFSSPARFIDNQRIEGTIPEMLEDTLAFIRRNTQTATIVNSLDGQRQDEDEYPTVAVRELLLNALVHRDYSIYNDDRPVRIQIFDDRLEIESPGSLFGRSSTEWLGKESGETRNPFLVSALETMQLTENRFSGIPLVYKEMKRRNLPDPVFENLRHSFKVILYSKTQSDKSQIKATIPAGEAELTEESLLKFCQIPRSRTELKEFLNIKTFHYINVRYLTPLIEQGKLKMTAPDAPKSSKQKWVTISNPVSTTDKSSS